MSNSDTMREARRFRSDFLFGTAAAFAHPHFTKEISFRWDREDSEEARKLVLRHITVPYNEMKAGNLPTRREEAPALVQAFAAEPTMNRAGVVNAITRYH